MTELYKNDKEKTCIQLNKIKFTILLKFWQ
jgi:hypothetical protein